MLQDGASRPGPLDCSTFACGLRLDTSGRRSSSLHAAARGRASCDGSVFPPPRILSGLSRRTTSGQLITEIDGLRFFSIALVVLFHLEGYVAGASRVQYAVGSYENPLRYLLHHGNQGVELFFIISGFVLALPFAAHQLTGGRKVNLPAYFTRRLTRLEPPYPLAVPGTFVTMNVVRGLEWPSARSGAARALLLRAQPAVRQGQQHQRGGVVAGDRGAVVRRGARCWRRRCTAFAGCGGGARRCRG